MSLNFFLGIMWRRLYQGLFDGRYIAFSIMNSNFSFAMFSLELISLPFLLLEDCFVDDMIFNTMIHIKTDWRCTSHDFWKFSVIREIGDLKNGKNCRMTTF